MANLTRYDPFSLNLDDFFKSGFLRPVKLDMEVPDVQIKMNVTRSDGAYTVEAEMPGVRKEDIHLTVDGAMVTITGEVKKQSEEKKGDQVLRSERYFGKVERTFSLPQDIDEAHVEANYADGVLKVTLPLLEQKKPKAVEIA